MDLQRIFENKSLFATRKVDNEMILVPVRNNIANMDEIYNLNELGCFIWAQIDAVNTKEIILNKIILEFDIDEKNANRDFDEFIKKLEGIIK